LFRCPFIFFAAVEDLSRRVVEAELFVVVFFLVETIDKIFFIKVFFMCVLDL